MKRIEFMIRGALAAFAAVGILAAIPAANAQTVSINGQQQCQAGSVNMGVSATGDVTITCTPVSTNTTPTAPNCTVAPQTITQGAAVNATLSAVCTGGAATTFAWSVGSGAPPIVSGAGTSSIVVGPFPNTGSYAYTLDASNTTGHSPLASTTVTVNATTVSNGPPPNCTAGGTQVTDTVPDTGWFRENTVLSSGAFVSFKLPLATAAGLPNGPTTLFGPPPGHVLSFSTVQSTPNLPIEMTVSQCIGDFNTTADCAHYGSAENFQWGAVTGSAPIAGSCVLNPGVQYYLNVRSMTSTGVNGCPSGSCVLIVFTQPGWQGTWP